MTTAPAREEHRVTDFPQASSDGVTVGQLRQLMRHLPPQAPVRLGISADHRFNMLIGDVPVHTAYAHPGVAGAALVLRVDGLS